MTPKQLGPTTRTPLARRRFDEFTLQFGACRPGLREAAADDDRDGNSRRAAVRHDARDRGRRRHDNRQVHRLGRGVETGDRRDSPRISLADGWIATTSPAKPASAAVRLRRKGSGFARGRRSSDDGDTARAEQGVLPVTHRQFFHGGGEQRRSAAGMEEKNVVDAGVSTFGQRAAVPGHGLAGVNGVEKHAFGARRG